MDLPAPGAAPSTRPAASQPPARAASQERASGRCLAPSHVPSPDFSCSKSPFRKIPGSDLLVQVVQELQVFTKHVPTSSRIHGFGRGFTFWKAVPWCDTECFCLDGDRVSPSPPSPGSLLALGFLHCGVPGAELPRHSAKSWISTMGTSCQGWEALAILSYCHRQGYLALHPFPAWYPCQAVPAEEGAGWHLQHLHP